MAEVFSGHSLGDHGFQKPVAIKRLLPELASDQVFVARLIDEAKLLVGMQHGNIVSVLDLARDGDDVFLVMEFVDGPSLRQLLKSRGSRGLSLGTATYIVQAAAAGLEFAHARPGGAIIHADISPSNLLLTTSGEVRVADFGIARREGGGYGVVEGKWAYMAPEQARGEPLTPRSDVFALGVVLYELICGAHPFGRTVTHEERDSEPMRVIPPRVVKPSIPAGIDRLVMRALAHDPRDRYARMQQLIDAIVEERFANQWREGASDLAQAIRECTPGAAAQHQPRTMVTDRPVTIMTRSLLRELTPARRSSMPGMGGHLRADAEGTPPPEPSQSFAAEQPSQSYSQSQSQSAPAAPDQHALAAEIMRAAALMEIPAAFRADGTPIPPFRFGADRANDQDLSHVVGGHTMTGTAAAPSPDVDARSGRTWTIGILAAAALIGVVAAVAIKSNGKREDAAAAPAAPAVSVPSPTKVAVKEAQPELAPPDEREPEDTHRAAPPPVIAEKQPEVAPDKQPEVKQSEVKQPEIKQPEVKQPEVKPEVKPVAPPPRPSTRPAATPTPPAAPAPSSKEVGYVRITTYPWGWASSGGQRVETAAGKLTLPVGRHTIQIKCGPECSVPRSQTRVVNVKANLTEVIRITWDEEDE
ncbi:MAG: protein kinase [Deltaproteobacteria bacterium]|nr:protein kinase [Deltaproteobacteria bacterium]